MNEEPKARPSINLDELERQLREASRNQAFRQGVPEYPSHYDRERSGEHGFETELPGTGHRSEDVNWRSQQSETDVPYGRVGGVPYSQNDSGTQGQFPPSFLMKIGRAHV